MARKLRYLFTLFALSLIGVAVPANAGFYLSGGASVYQTTDSDGTGWIGSIGGGYGFNPYLLLGASVGYGNYYIRDDDGRRLRVDVVPTTIAVTGQYPTQYITPYLSVGPTWTWIGVEDREWVDYWGAGATAGLRIHLGVLGLTPYAGYSFYDLGDLSKGAFTYGLSFGFSI